MMKTSRLVMMTPAIRGMPKRSWQRDGRANHFGEVAGGDGDLREEPECDAHRAAVAVAAGLGEVTLRGDAQLEREALKQDGHQVRGHDDEQERVAVLRSGGKIGGPVAGVHVPNRDHEARADESEGASPQAMRIRDADGRVNSGQRGSALCLLPHRNGCSGLHGEESCSLIAVCHSMLTVINKKF